MLKDFLLSGWRPYALIVLLVAAVYVKTLSFGFVDYDDVYLIVTNHRFLSDISNFFDSFSRDVFNVEFFESSKSYYRPLLTITFMIDAQLGGTEPFMYHLSNVLLHAVASCLVFLLLRRMDFRRDPSLLLAALFAVHPALTLAVAWVPGRGDPLMAIFALLSLLWFINGVNGKGRIYHLLSQVFFLMALFSKETAIGLIIVIIAYMLFLKKNELSRSTILLSAASWICTAVLWFYVRSHVVENTDITLSLIVHSVTENITGLLYYTGKVLIPTNLSVFMILKDAQYIYGIAGLIFLAVIIALSRNRRPGMIVFGFVWFIAFLLPSLVSKQPGPNTLLFEHRLYLPAIGLILILMETDFIKKFTFDRIRSVCAGIAVVSLFSVLSFHHSNSMKDPMSFWTNAVSTSPNSSVAHLNLGDKYFAQKMLDKAEFHTIKALELNPEQLMAHNNLGRIHAVKGEFVMAESEFLAELALNPSYENALYNLGMINYETGRIKEAVQYWQKVLEVNSYNINANYYLAIYFYKSGMLKQAQDHIDRLLERGVRVNTDSFRGLKLDH